MSQKKNNSPQPIQPGSVLYRLLQLAAVHLARRSQPGKPQMGSSAVLDKMPKDR